MRSRRSKCAGPLSLGGRPSFGRPARGPQPSRRTREALQAAKARGVKKRVNPQRRMDLRRAGNGGAPLRAAVARNADRHAKDLAPVLEDIHASGHTSLGAMATELNARGMLTRRGGRWHKSTMINLIERLGQRGAGVEAV